MNFKRIAIFGLGLLGGSLCRDIRRISGDVELLAFGRNPGKLKKALDDGLVDFIGSVKEPDLKDVDLIIVSLPAAASIGVINDLLNNPEFGDESIIIDVGSVKETIVKEIEKNKKAGRFIGCHPMAGSEKMGYENSREELFNNASVIITPNKFNNKEDIEKITRFWENLKAKTILLPASLHDFIVSYTSHLPHMLACLIVDLYKDIAEDNSLKDHIGSKEVRHFIGGGFRDVTRISSSSPYIWTDISILNNHNISKSLAKLIEKLQILKEIFDSDNINPEELFLFFERIRNYKLALDCE